MKRLIEALALALAALPTLALAEAPAPERLLGVGSRLAFTRELRFLGGTSAMFCDGKEAGTFESIRARYCCELKVGVPLRVATEVTVRAERPHVVTHVDDLRTQVVIDVPTETTLRCRNQKISVEMLRRGFGDVLRVEEVVPPPEPRPEERVEI